MNILKARNELHQIAKNNPQTDHFHFFQPNFINNDPLVANHWKHQRHPKILHSQNPQYHLFKDENIKKIPEKTINQQKVQVKTPIFKNKKGEDFSSSKKQRFEKLGLENFLQQSLLEKKLMEKHDEPIEQKIIKNLNNTYFRSTEKIHGKRKNMVNSLGIKKSSMSNYKVDWDEKNIDQLEIEWRDIGYIPNKVFPCRKNTSVKNKIYTPKKKESPKKDTNELIEKTKTNDTSLIEKTASASFLQSKELCAKNSLLNMNQKVLSLQSSRIMHKEKKVFINSSKKLNRSQQLALKPQISRVFTIDKSRPISEKRRRPWTSKQTLMRNQKIPEHLIYAEKVSGKRRYSEANNRSFYNFKESWKKEKLDSKKSIMKSPQIEDGSDFIKGKKISINHPPEQRIAEYF